MSMYKPTIEELYSYSSKTFSITCEPYKPFTGSYSVKYRLIVKDEVNKEIIEIVEGLADSFQVKHDFNIIKDRYILDYQQKLVSSKLIAA